MTISSIAYAVALYALAAARPTAAQCSFSEASVPARPVLVYRFGLATAGDTTLLHVDLEFTGSPTGVDTISVPSQWAGQRPRAVHNLRAVDAGVRVDSILDHPAHVVTHPPGGRVRLAYELVKDWAGPVDHPYEFHPMVSADYIELTGSNALVRPRYDNDTSIVADFDWTALPPTWAVATSFGTAERSSDEQGGAKRNNRCQIFSGTLRDVTDGLYAAGDFRVHRFTIGDKPAVLAIRGTWGFSDSAVVAELRRDVQLVRDFWHDDNFPYFLVTWAPFEHSASGTDGTAFTNALWMYVPKSDSLKWQIPTITHETFHAWDPRQMGGVTNAEAQKIGWFHEGFTMYYADLLAYRAGILPLANVVRRANRNLAGFAGSTDPYTRGDVIAWWLDGAIRDQSQGKRSLDDVMHDMVRDGDQPLTLDRIFATANRYLRPDDQATLRQLATGTGPAPSTISAGGLAPCVHVTVDSVNVRGASALVPQLHIDANYVPRPGECMLSDTAAPAARTGK